MTQIILLPPDREPKACDSWEFALKWLETCPEKHFEVHALEIDEPGARPRRWVAQRRNRTKTVKRLHSVAGVRWHADGVLYARANADSSVAEEIRFSKGQDIEQTVRALPEGAVCFWRFTSGTNERGWFGTVKETEVDDWIYIFCPVV